MAIWMSLHIKWSKLVMLYTNILVNFSVAVTEMPNKNSLEEGNFIWAPGFRGLGP